MDRRTDLRFTTWGSDTVLKMDIDFETRSESGYFFKNGRWHSVSKSPPHGLGAVGAAVYSEHHSTEVVSISYENNIWTPYDPPPVDLLNHVARGGIVRAWYAFFEFLIWNNVCVPRHKWPPLRIEQIRDIMAQSYAHGCPGKLEIAGEALLSSVKKDKSGKRLITRYCSPCQPTKVNPSGYHKIEDHPGDYLEFMKYNLVDVAAEKSIAARLPELSEFEQQVCTLDMRINARGVAINTKGLDKLIQYAEIERGRLNAELARITNGMATTGEKLPDIKKWLNARGHPMLSMDKKAISRELEIHALPPDIRRVLEIRQQIGASSVTKTAAIKRRLCADGRIRGLFQYHGADRTGRFAGRGPQPQNLPSGGPSVRHCSHCGAYFDIDLVCPGCGSVGGDFEPWSPNAAGWILTADSIPLYLYFKNPMRALSGCLRALFVASPGHTLVCSDYSAIEAVVLAELAGETWRQEVFRTHGKIYEMSAAKISGVPFEEILAHKERTGHHHKLRSTIGKIGELASGFSGWIGAWKNFGADKFMTDDEIKTAILKWRADSPAIVEFWGGQVDKNTRTPRRYGIEGAAVNAIENPGVEYAYRTIKYICENDVLFCVLPSGRRLAYHQPRLTPSHDRFTGLPIYAISYMGYNSDSTKGPVGWIRMATYGGKLTENIVQAVARDILVFAMLALEYAGFPIVLHVHDETVCEVPDDGKNYVPIIEAILSIMPSWAEGWPVVARGGWQELFYRKA